VDSALAWLKARLQLQSNGKVTCPQRDAEAALGIAQKTVRASLCRCTRCGILIVTRPSRKVGNKIFTAHYEIADEGTEWVPNEGCKTPAKIDWATEPMRNADEPLPDLTPKKDANKSLKKRIAKRK
jgi:hypothetical protein